MNYRTHFIPPGIKGPFSVSSIHLARNLAFTGPLLVCVTATPSTSAAPVTIRESYTRAVQSSIVNSAGSRTPTMKNSLLFRSCTSFKFCPKQGALAQQVLSNTGSSMQPYFPCLTRSSRILHPLLWVVNA